MASVAVPPSPSPADPRPNTPPIPQPSPGPPPARPPRSLSRPSNITISLEAVLQSTPRRRGTSGLALQARDSLAVRKRAMSTGATSARVARHNARMADMASAEPTAGMPGRSPSRPAHGSRTPSSSSSSSSQSLMPITPGQPQLSGAPSSYQDRGRTHIPHDSQGTTTSAYPPSSSISIHSSSPSPERSRTPSVALPRKASFPTPPPATSLDLDPDDVNARLRLLVNNSYFLPPAHAKPALPVKRLPFREPKSAGSPSAFKEFFRVVRKKERKASEPNGYASEGARRTAHGRLLRMPSRAPSSVYSDGHFDGSRLVDGVLDISPQGEHARNRVVVVRETVDDLPPPLQRIPLREHAYNTIDATYNDPTTQYDVPPPTQYPSFINLRLDTSGMARNAEIDQFVPPGEPWSPTPSSPLSGMDPQERVWRRAILEQAVDLSLSSTNSEAGMLDGRTRRMNSEDSSGLMSSPLGTVTPAGAKSPKSKRSWWGRKDKDVEDGQRRPSSSSSSTSHELGRMSSPLRGKKSVEVDSQSLQRKRELIGKPILENTQADLEEWERELRERELKQGHPPPHLRLGALGSATVMSYSAPVTPLHDFHISPEGGGTVLRPPPRRGEKGKNSSGEDATQEFLPGRSTTIQKSLSSPLLSEMHETGVDVQSLMASSNASVDSSVGVAAPSFVLQDPSGVTSVVHSNTVYSVSSGSHYQDDDESGSGVISSAEQDDSVSFEHWHFTGPHDGSGRPSFDSFGAERMRSPDYHPRASSTFGIRRSHISGSTPSPLRDRQGLEMDISGDPMEHLSVMDRSSTPSAGYASALDHTYAGLPDASAVGRSSSPDTASVYSAGTRMASPELPSNESGMEAEAPIQFFDSIQHDSLLDDEGDDDESSDSEEDTPQGNTVSFPISQEQMPEPPPLTRKSFNSTRPAPPFTMQFRNASQPQLPVTRAEMGPRVDTLRPVISYDLLDRKRPLTNSPLSLHATASTGILSRIKERQSKSPVKMASQLFGIGKGRPGTSPGLAPDEPTFDLLRYPSGATFFSGSGAGSTATMTGSDVDSMDVRLRPFDGVRSQGSLLSLPGSDAVSLQPPPSIQSHSTQDETLRKLDGMMMQHLEEERNMLRKITDAVRERGGGSRDGHQN